MTFTSSELQAIINDADFKRKVAAYMAAARATPTRPPHMAYNVAVLTAIEAVVGRDLDQNVGLYDDADLVVDYSLTLNSTQGLMFNVDGTWRVFDPSAE